jgi:hypothetical protein
MHDEINGPLDPIAARNAVAGHRSRGTADPEVEKHLRTVLATAKIDKAIRESVAACPAPLHPAQVEYLVGLITGAGAEK